MLAARGNPDDDTLLQELLEADEKVADVAATALLRRRGLGDLDSRLHRKKYDEKLPLNEAERRHDAMQRLDTEVCNGGFAQFFVNSTGDDWDAALDGLTAHDPERAQLLREAVARFATVPSRDRETRQRQLAEIAADVPFRDLDRRYYASTQSIDVVLLRHALAHADELRSR